MTSRDERIASLATTLKTSGIAKSEAQARMMAEEMIGVEENVQKKYDEEHSKAHEFLNNTKNLGEPRVRKVESAPESKIESKVESKIASKSEPSFTSRYGIAPLTRQTSSQETKPIIEKESIPDVKAVPETKSEPVKPEAPKIEKVEEPKITESSDNFPKFIPGKIAPEHTDVNFGSGSLQDLMMSQIKSDHHEIKALEDTVPEDVAPKKIAPPKQAVQELLDEVGEEIKEIEEKSPEETIISDSVEDTRAIDTTMELTESLEDAKDAKSEVVEENIEEDTVSGIEPEKGDESSSDTSSDSDETSNDKSSQNESPKDESPQLDSKKLQEMMEEDGPMEEKTREITEKPKDVKPKEEYVENSIDLGNIFNVNK